MSEQGSGGGFDYTCPGCGWRAPDIFAEIAHTCRVCDKR